MISDFEQTLIDFESASLQLPESPFMAVNGKGYCIGVRFKTPESVEDHIQECRILTRRRLDLCPGKGNCEICTPGELCKFLPQVQTAYTLDKYPFGNKKGMVNYDITIVVPIDIISAQ